MCQITNFGPFQAGSIKERLVEFDPTAMTLVYQSVEERGSGTYRPKSVSADGLSRWAGRVFAARLERGVGTSNLGCAATRMHPPPGPDGAAVLAA